MVSRDEPVPRHIEPDAIIEAILEIRFNAPTILPEVMFGRLTENAEWRGFLQRRMPAYEIPAPMREADANFRFAPILELVGVDTNRTVRIGPHVFSYHCTVKYPGWPAFRGELNEAIDELFKKATDLTVIRIGMRYLNALRTDLHAIGAISDLDLEVSVARDAYPESMNLNFFTGGFEDARCMIRIATKDFVQGPAAPEARVFVDVDVFTNDSFSTTDASSVKQWTDNAHTHLKQEFFHLLKPETIALLRRD